MVLTVHKAKIRTEIKHFQRLMTEQEGPVDPLVQHSLLFPAITSIQLKGARFGAPIIYIATKASVYSVKEIRKSSAPSSTKVAI